MKAVSEREEKKRFQGELSVLAPCDYVIAIYAALHESFVVEINIKQNSTRLNNCFSQLIK